MTIAIGLALRLAPIAEDPLHPDECLYASWALAVREGDLWLRGPVIDKPPGFPYLLALWSTVIGPGPTALRLLGALASLVAMVLFFRVARRSWGEWPAWAGLTLVALSPAAVALDGAALTDPPAVALAMGGIAAALSGAPIQAGLWLGLAGATKPQLLAYAPAVLGVLPGRSGRAVAKACVGLAAVVAVVVLWEWVRAPRMGWASAAYLNYGLSGATGRADAGEWAALLGWIWGTRPAQAVWILAVVGALVATVGGLSKATRPGPALGIAASAFAYLAVHLAVGAPPWDRYLLALIPLAGLAFAWAVSRLGAGLTGPARALVGPLFGAALAAALVTPALEASRSMLPLGDTSRWQGIEGLADYVRGQVPGRATILHRDLGWQVSYYLAGYPQDFRWYRDREQLVDECARANPAYVLVVADEPGLGDLEHLASEGFRLGLRHATYRRDGHPALLLYLVEGKSDGR
ncbi:MAG: hypothetical protein HPY83_14060 [Anaerolineae bacterium]|nr:hypothetical protein [Anaerolineae bacterium]